VQTADLWTNWHCYQDLHLDAAMETTDGGTNGTLSLGPGTRELLRRACLDQALLMRLVADPVGTAWAEGVRPTADDLKRLLKIDGATDLELLEVLTTIIARRLR
jgi:hypothetical protein